MTKKKITRALVSVYDKTGLVELGKSLASGGVEILSTGSTASTLREAGVAVTDVSSYTGFPEIMGGALRHFIHVYILEFLPIRIILITSRRLPS